jgi:hypothetical protein
MVMVMAMVMAMDMDMDMDQIVPTILKKNQKKKKLYLLK